MISLNMVVNMYFG